MWTHLCAVVVKRFCLQWLQPPRFTFSLPNSSVFFVQQPWDPLDVNFSTISCNMSFFVLFFCHVRKHVHLFFWFSASVYIYLLTSCGWHVTLSEHSHSLNMYRLYSRSSLPLLLILSALRSSLGRVITWELWVWASPRGRNLDLKERSGRKRKILGEKIPSAYQRLIKPWGLCAQSGLWGLVLKLKTQEGKGRENER